MLNKKAIYTNTYNILH
jgi:hypothetical protein